MADKKPAIRIRDRELNWIGEIDDYASLVYITRWHTQGEFEIRINARKKYVEHLQSFNFIELIGDEGSAGIILDREIEENENGATSDVWMIKGVCLKGLAKQRITYPPAGQAYSTITGPAEAVMKRYINENIVNPADLSRQMPATIIEADQGRGPIITYSTRYKDLSEELKIISETTGLGWGAKRENGLITFYVKEGRDLTAGQTENPPVIFSVEFDSLSGSKYIESYVNYKSTAIIGGQGEGELRDVIEVGPAAGFDRQEVFIDARDIEEGMDLTERGEQRLSEYQKDYTFEGTIPIKGSFRYKRDFELGDIATVRNPKWGVRTDSRITEIREAWEDKGYSIGAGFGNNVPTFYDIVNRQFRQMGNEIRK